MSVYTVGRLCMKLAGRDAGKACVIVEKVDERFVVVDGATRRRKVNVAHLEPLDEKLDIKAKASHDDVKAAFKKLGVEVVDTKPKKAAARPKRVRKKKEKPVAEEKKAAKKEVKKPVEKVAETAKKEETAAKE